MLLCLPTAFMLTSSIMTHRHVAFHVSSIVYFILSAVNEMRNSVICICNVICLLELVLDVSPIIRSLTELASSQSLNLFPMLIQT